MVVSFAAAVIRTLDALASRPATGRWGGAHGSVLFGSMAPGGGLFTNSEFELNRESRGTLSLWSCCSMATCGTTMARADYSRGPLPVGLSVGRTLRLGTYRGRAAGGT